MLSDELIVQRPVGPCALSYRTSERIGRSAQTYRLTHHAGIRKDARSLGIGRGTKCRRPMYKRTHYASTPCGSPGRGWLLGDPQGILGLGWVAAHRSPLRG